MLQDGSCGNFNSDPSDDTTQAIFSRIGARVPKGELLFQHRAEVNFTEVEQKLLAMCAHDRFQAAEHACMKEPPVLCAASCARMRHSSEFGVF